MQQGGRLTDLVAAEPHGHGLVVGRVGAAAGRVDAAQLALVVLDPALRLLLDQVLRLALTERRDVLERACVKAKNTLRMQRILNSKVWLRLVDLVFDVTHTWPASGRSS